MQRTSAMVATHEVLAGTDAYSGRRLVAHGHTRKILASPLGLLFARPWLDHLTLRALKHVFFPLSRLWAAAEAAEGSPDAFWELSGQPRRHEHRERLINILATFEEARVTSAATDTAWENTFFGASDTNVATRVALESARHNLRDTLNKQRRLFVPLVSSQTPRVKLDIVSPAVVAATYDPARDTDELFTPPLAMPPVQISQSVPGVASIDSWLRFPSPSARMADTCWARVHTPEGISNPPTVILGHGVCVDFDHWHGLLDEALALVAHGIRVIRPEAPWHGRRTPRGYFGGERAIGTFPTGMIDLFVAAIQEWGVIADWARRTSSGALGVGGTSLGALTAQLCASVAHPWPERLKPEALYLMTHSGAMSEAMMTGAVSTLFADPAKAEAKGWTPAIARRLMSMIDPVRPPVMAPARIVSVLGSRDVITPFDGGETLVWRWAVPPENVFVSKRGHFTIPMSLARNGAPTRRFAEIMKGL